VIDNERERKKEYVSFICEERLFFGVINKKSQKTNKNVFILKHRSGLLNAFDELQDDIYYTNDCWEYAHKISVMGP